MTSSLLIDEGPLQVLPTLATAVGLNEAIILQQIHYWVKLYQKAGDKHHRHIGEWWVYNTIEEWRKNFPFWSERTIARALDSLRKPYTNQGEDDPCPSRGPLVVTGNFNRQGYDRTLWYRIDYAELDKLTEAIMTKCHDGSCQDVAMDDDNMAEPIPETTQETTQKNNSRSPANAGGLSDLDPDAMFPTGETETPQEEPMRIERGKETVLGLAAKCEQRSRGKEQWTVTPEAGGADPWANGPVTALMELAGVAELPDKKRRQWARKIAELAAQWDATPERVTTAIKAIRDSDQGWRSITGPHEKQFASVLDVMMARTGGAAGPQKVIRISR